MLSDLFISNYTRDLKKVVEELKGYGSDDQLWIVKDGILNSGGNLALHLIGNINHFFGAILGNTGYERDRDMEFSDKNVSRGIIISRLEETIEIMKNSLGLLSDDDFSSEYPEEFQGNKITNAAVATYMLSHLNYHLGQINYHRRIVSS